MSAEDDKRAKFAAQARRLREFLSRVKPIGVPDDTITDIVCSRVDEGPPLLKVQAGRHYDITTCRFCGQFTWIDPESRRVAPKAGIVCTQCLVTQKKTN